MRRFNTIYVTFGGTLMEEAVQCGPIQLVVSNDDTMIGNAPGK